MKRLWLILLAACGTDQSSTELASTYDYSLIFNWPIDCSGSGVLDLEADTLGLTTNCVGGIGGGSDETHANAPITRIVQDGSHLTFDFAECAHVGTIADDEITGTIICLEPHMDLSGTWSAHAISP